MVETYPVVISGDYCPDIGYRLAGIDSGHWVLFVEGDGDAEGSTIVVTLPIEAF